MSEATKQALDGLRDISSLKWYVIPLLAIVFYIYTKEIGKARRTHNWDAVLAGLTVFGLDFFNETWNGWVMVLTGRSALWTAPGETALRTTVGWNIEIMFMFLLLGIVYYHSLSETKDKKILGINEKWVGDRIYHRLRGGGGHAQSSRAARVGVSILECEPRGHMADPADRLFSLLRGRDHHDQPKEDAQQAHHAGHRLRRTHYHERYRGRAGVAILIFIVRKKDGFHRPFYNPIIRAPVQALPVF
jgi:hypothetical protein